MARLRYSRRLTCHRAANRNEEGRNHKKHKRHKKNQAVVPIVLFVVSSLFGSLLRRPVLEIQLSAIGKNDLCPWISGSYVCHRLAIFSRTQNDCDFIARLDGAPCPAGPSQDTRT